jgi:exopolysaccharide biosynthesis protein
MHFIRMLIVIVIVCCGSCLTDDAGYYYEVQKLDEHVLHIVTVNPKKYDVNIVKANNGAVGRETVSSMAKRSNAEIAINGGFFEIGDLKNGMPSRSLVIDGKVYKAKNQLESLIIINFGKVLIQSENPKKYIQKKPHTSLVSGIPLLISHGKIVQDLLQKDGEFYTKPHARTAVGIKPDGTIIITVAEHHYQKDLVSLTLGEVKSFMQEKTELLSQRYSKNPGDITLNELKEILEEHFSSKDGAKGLSLLSLAHLMEKLGCEFAINLDGGGSSTLWINGKVVNQTFGDQDEGNSLQTVRPVSDSIVFKKKCA